MLHYYIGILKKITFTKFINYINLIVYYTFSKIQKKAVLKAMPFSISVEPTTSCNLRCPQCPSGLRSFTRDTGMLNANFFENYIVQFKKYLHNVLFYFQGEPFLNPNFLKLVKIANHHNIYTITSTNAHYITDDIANDIVTSKLDKLIISIDGASQATYQNYRVGGMLNKVIDGTNAVLNAKKKLKSNTPFVVWQFVVFKTNEHEIDTIKVMAKEIGVNKIVIKTAQIYDFETSEHLIPNNINYSRYKLVKGAYQIKNKLLNECWRMWQGCVITWDGKIVPCCFDKDAKYTLGNLNTATFKEIWFSKEYNKFRDLILSNRKQIDICTNCTEGTKVWA